MAHKLAQACYLVGFMHDQFSDERSFRLSDVLDDFNREGLSIGVVCRCVRPA